MLKNVRETNAPGLCDCIEFMEMKFGYVLEAYYNIPKYAKK